MDLPGTHRPQAEEIAMKRLTALMLLAVFAAGMLTACNTVEGAGQDIQKAGEKVSDKAEDCKDPPC